jgi:serine/threonine protein kinase
MNFPWLAPPPPPSIQAAVTAVTWTPPEASNRSSMRKASFRRPVAEPVAARAITAGNVLGGRYRLEAPLAEGGMGTLWSAIDETTGAEVAVKLMSFELAKSADAVGRFRQEAEVIARIDCVHIVRFLDQGVVASSPYLVLERLHGEDLAQRLKRGPLGLAETATILDHIARALVAAHVGGVIHRDVKPANIFLVDDGATRIAKLLDFGVAKLCSGGRVKTGAGIAVGSPSFMSPEQLQGLPDVDGRSDVFALAVVAYACLTGKSAFAGVHLHDTFQKIMRGLFAAPSVVMPGLPPELDAFFTRALAVRREDRFPNAAVMARTFRAIVEESQGSPTVRGGVTPMLALSA